nr:Mu transposase C-terminal domain-containing protein [Escherichia coli]
MAVKVLISYDIHDAERITVRRLDGSVICEAVWDGNKTRSLQSARNTTNNSSVLKACVNAGKKFVIPG